LSQDYAEFQLIAADVDYNPAALLNALSITLFEAIKDSLTHSDMAEDLPALVTVDHKRDKHIRQ